MIELLHGDCVERMRGISDDSIDLAVCDPPYNIAVKSEIRGGKRITNEWDRIDDYLNWSLQWIKEVERVLKKNGVFYFFHNDIGTIAELLHLVNERTAFRLQSFCVWNKGESYRSISWKNNNGNAVLRSWFNICEYCVHLFKTDGEEFRSLKDWCKTEMRRLGLTEKDIARKYTEVTGKEPYMFRHYFHDSQFEIPTREIWDSVYIPLGFGKGHDALRDEYEALRPYHAADRNHSNVWNVNTVPNNKYRSHICEKPVEILERIVRVSSRPGETVLDCFMGSGSTMVACVNTGRNGIGIELDEKYFKIAEKRVMDAKRLKESSLDVACESVAEPVAASLL